MEQVNVGTQGGKPATELKGLVGPLTLRDTVVIAGAILLLVGSLIPIPWTKTVNVNMWIFPGLPFHLLVSLLMPLGVGVAFAWRRFSGRTRVRVGSLSLDQFGSITALISGAYFFNSYAATMSVAYLLGLLGAVAMLVGTTLARYFGVFRSDFVRGSSSVITEDVNPVAGTDATRLNAPVPAAVGDADEVFGARETVDGPRPVPQAPRVETPAAPSATVLAGLAASSAVTPEKKASVTALGTEKPEPSETSADGTEDSGNSENSVERAEAPESQQEVAEAHEAGSEPAAKITKVTDSSVPSTDSDEVSASRQNDAAAQVKHNATASTDFSAQKTPEDSAAVASALRPEPQEDVAAGAEASAAAEEPVLIEAGTEAQDAAPENTAGTDNNDPAEQEKAADKSGAKESVKTEIPEATLTQDAAEETPDVNAGTSLISILRETPAKKSEEKVAQVTADATAAIPAARVAPDATAALSRAELSAQMAEAAHQSKAAESSFGARANLEPAEPVAKSFWFALNQPRPVYDPRSGATISTLQPGIWILCLEDRGGDYLISLEGGRQAVLRDLDNLQFPEN